MKCRRYITSGVLAKNPLAFRVVNKPLKELDDCVGRCWPNSKLRLIEVDPRQSPKDYLDTLIHESLHELFPKKRENVILKAGTSIANLLWRLGYRRVKKRG